MRRFFTTLFLLLAFAAPVALAWAYFSLPDPEYTLQERVWPRTYAQYDDLIAAEARKHGLPPSLVKAIVWRESRFRPEKRGTKGERGLMQMTELAAQDWAKAEKIETFLPPDLYDARNNLEAGTWYVAKAMERWKGKDDPVPFVLAEYNAGRARVNQWIAATKRGESVTAGEFLSLVDFPNTRQYIEDITERQRFFEARGGL